MRLNLSSQKEAVETVKGILRGAGYTSMEETLLNEGRHCVILCKDPEREYRAFYIKWENELFHSARIKWEELKNEDTRGGCTLNVSAVEGAKMLPATILFASNEDGVIYAIEAKDFDEIATKTPRRQDLTGEMERCVLVERLKPWGLLPAEIAEQVTIIECDTCGYKAVQSRADPYATGLKMSKELHEKTFGHLGHVVTAYQTTKFDPIALRLRENLNRWERW
jgi:hypothetical protein